MEILTASLQEYTASFSLNKFIMLLMVIFMIVGGIDRIIGNKFGFGEEFAKGFEALGDLATAMVGMIALVPVIKIVFGSALGAFFSMIGSDPSLFSGIVLGMDLGGYSLSMSLANTPDLGLFTGIIIASVMGINIVFNIPVGMGIIDEKDQPYLAVGMLIGFITIPVAIIAGGLVMMVSGFEVTIHDIIFNTIPVAVVAAAIAAGLLLAQKAILKGFIAFGKGVTAVVTFGTMVAVAQYLTGIHLPLFHVMVEADAEGVVPLIDAIEVVGEIGLVLLGAFPLVLFITRAFKKPLNAIGTKMGLDQAGIGGLIATIANTIPMFGMMKDMSPKSKIFNCAFAVSTCFALGDHLGFVAGVNQQMIVPMIAAKFAGGISALILASLLWEKLLPKED